jgi:hypothetical protein
MITTQQIPATLAQWEKNREKFFCQAKSRKNRQLLGERLPGYGRDSRTVKHLRTEQPPLRHHKLLGMIRSVQYHGKRKLSGSPLDYFYLNHPFNRCLCVNGSNNDHEVNYAGVL